jgi:tetratricopeptide (TPR) repeat protein
LRFCTTFVLVSASLFAGSHLDDGIAHQRAGRLKEADRELRAAITELSAAGNQRDLLNALSVESWISVSLGNYSDAIQQATHAVRLRRELHDEKHLADDLNTLALANQSLGMYMVALDELEQALLADRKAGDLEGEITRLNNIGNVYYFEGRYVDALRFYEQAKSRVDATSSESWNPRRRHMTLANIAAVYQILGKEEAALGLYKELTASSDTMPAHERAQLLANQGALYRRLGDPVKALELYESAQELYESDRYSDGEIGVLRNTGIARAMEMSDPEGALVAFSSALRLAFDSSNRRGAVQARLYRSEAYRLLQRLREAVADAQSALEAAESAGLVEEQWRSLYVLGRIAEQSGRRDEARRNYADAIALIESIRTGLNEPSLRTEFLADKRDVYDALIGLRLQDGSAVDEVFRLIERSRARSLNESVSLASPLDLHAIQSHLPRNSILIDFWTGADSVASVWITPSEAGITRHNRQIGDAVKTLMQALQGETEQWYDAGRVIGDVLLSGIPQARHLLIVPDGPLSTIPFEVVAEPRSKSLLIEQSDISYLPSAQFLVRAEAAKYIRLPWQRQMVALGDPPVSSSDIDRSWQRLEASGAEIHSIERILPGRSEIHLGVDAKKRYIEEERLENLPILHFSTHAFVDPESPDHSRILLASDYLFQREIYGLDLKGVDLVTVSACDTARGKTIRGEGVQAFSRAFLAAGATSTVTSLWRVADEPTASFMKQFYYFLSKGQSKSEALRSAKLAFLHSQSGLAAPRYWGAFVLTGNGANPLPSVASWSLVFIIGGAVLASVAVARTLAIRAERQSQGRAAALTGMHQR